MAGEGSGRGGGCGGPRCPGVGCAVLRCLLAKLRRARGVAPGGAECARPRNPPAECERVSAIREYAVPRIRSSRLCTPLPPPCAQTIIYILKNQIFRAP